MPSRGQRIVIERGASTAGCRNLVGQWYKGIRSTPQTRLKGVVQCGERLAREPVFVTGGGHTGQAWREELDERTVVGIERGCGKQVRHSGQIPSVEHEEPPGCGQERIAAPRGKTEETLAQTREVDGPWAELPHQADDGTIRVEIPSPETRLRENGENRAYDRVELFARELVERQPLAEHPAWCQALCHDLVHLTGVEVPGAGMPGDKEVSHDDIKAVAVGSEVAATVVKHEAHVRAFE